MRLDVILTDRCRYSVKDETPVTHASIDRSIRLALPLYSHTHFQRDIRASALPREHTAAGRQPQSSFNSPTLLYPYHPTARLPVITHTDVVLPFLPSAIISGPLDSSLTSR